MLDPDEVAPNVNDCPKQTEALDAATVGVVFTFILDTAVFVHPVNVFVPVTVYEAVADGVKADAFITPPVQIYVFAPVPLNVVELPEQITELVTVEPTVIARFAGVTDPDVTPPGATQLEVAPLKANPVRAPLREFPDTSDATLTAPLDPASNP